MSTLTRKISSRENHLPISAALSRDGGFIAQIGEEFVAVQSGGLGVEIVVERGFLGSARSAHASGSTVTPVQLVVQTDTPPAPPASSATPASIIVSEADPGAIGAQNFWLEVLFADENGDGGYGRLWTRNSTDDGWNAASSLSWSDATTTLVASPDDNAELSLRSAGHASALSGADALKLSGGGGSGKSLFLAATGVHIGPDALGPAFLTGSADPSAGGGVAARIGSVYLRVTGGAGTIWQKLAASDTAWAVIFDNTSLTAYHAPGAILLRAANSVTFESADGSHALVFASDGSLKIGDDRIGTQAAHVADGSTVDQLRDALIASGLMAAS